MAAPTEINIDAYCITCVRTLEYFFIDEEPLKNFLAGKDVFTLLLTGSSRHLIYQLGALH